MDKDLEASCNLKHSHHTREKNTFYIQNIMIITIIVIIIIRVFMVYVCVPVHACVCTCM